MFCPTCGAQSAQGLRYCNRCGANLSHSGEHSEALSAGMSIGSMVWAIVISSIILLGMGLGALVLMRDGAIDKTLGSALVILCFLMLPVVEGVLVWQLMRLNKKANDANWLPQAEVGTTRELAAAPARSLSEPVEQVTSVTSVTEETTRDLEPVYRKDARR